mmetsp:Transcript_129045/g.236996  ORF Transcript_129045/g.236996 Transcript_129045/m.236996 type:complete len:342 (+) Transcript_129045:107-1132(+)
MMNTERILKQRASRSPSKEHPELVNAEGVAERILSSPKSEFVEVPSTLIKRDPSRSPSSERGITDEEFISELLSQSDQFLDFLRVCDAEAYNAGRPYLERWSELIDETCMDYVKANSIMKREPTTPTTPSLITSASSDSTIQKSCARSQHSFHSPALEAMAKSAAAAKRRLHFAHSDQSVRMSVDTYEALACLVNEEEAIERHSRFKARVAKFLKEIGGDVKEAKHQAEQRADDLRALIREVHNMPPAPCQIIQEPAPRPAPRPAPTVTLEPAAAIRAISAEAHEKTRPVQRACRTIHMKPIRSRSVPGKERSTPSKPPAGGFRVCQLSQQEWNVDAAQQV